MTVLGSCLCGGVQFEVTGPLLDISRCHCGICRKLSGSVGNAGLFVGLPQFRWRGETTGIRSFTVETGWNSCFCTTCGCPAPNIDEPAQMVAVPAGLLDGDPGVPVGVHIWVGSKAAWDVVPDDAPHYEESWL